MRTDYFHFELSNKATVYHKINLSESSKYTMKVIKIKIEKYL